MTSSPPPDPHGKLSTAEIVRQMTGGEEPRHVAFGRWLQAAPEPVPIPTITMPPTPLEIAIAELTLIETKLRQYADVQGAIGILRRAEDVAIVRKALEGLS